MHKCFHKPILVLIEHGLSNGQALNTATGAKKHKQNTERSCCWIMISIKEGATRQKLESLKDFFLSIRFKGKERHLPRALFPISTTIKRREKTDKVCAKFHSRVTGLNLTTPVQYIQGVRVNNIWKINYIFLALEERAAWRSRLRVTLKEYTLNSSLSFIYHLNYERTAAGNEQKWYNLPYEEFSRLWPVLGSQLVGTNEIAAGAGQSRAKTGVEGRTPPLVPFLSVFVLFVVVAFFFNHARSFVPSWRTESLKQAKLPQTDQQIKLEWELGFLLMLFPS